MQDGPGPTVLLAADPPNGIEHQLPLLDALDGRARVIAFEPPGFGWSTVSSDYSWDVEGLVAVTRELLDATRTERAVLAYPCVLGLAAVRAAHEIPGRVQGLVLSQAPDHRSALAWRDGIDPKGRLSRPLIGQLFVHMGESRIPPQWYRAAEPDETRRLTYAAHAVARRKRGAVFTLASGLQGLDGGNPLDGIVVRCPTATLWGGADRSHTRDHATSLHRHLDAPWHRFDPEAGHFPELSRPDLFLAALDAVQ